MRPVYRAFLLGTATDLPTSAFIVAPERKRATELLEGIRRWDKVLSSAEH